METGEIARYEQFLLSHSVVKRLVLQTRKNQGLFGKGLTKNISIQGPFTSGIHKYADKVHSFLASARFLYQPITRRQNFRLVQIKTNCRRHLKVHLKWKISIMWVRKHCEKRRNCLLQAISPFLTMFSIVIYICVR